MKIRASCPFGTRTTVCFYRYFSRVTKVGPKLARRTVNVHRCKAFCRA
ncbi:hypothetical protein OH686_02600 [Pseudomonas sp. SO81]|nr:hypothetical protein OH686_02600 [Pseudomonas sp. SO81]